MPTAQVGLPFAFASVDFALGESAIDVAAEYPDAPDLVSKTGIPGVWESPVPAYELALDAAQHALEKAGDSGDRVTAILYVTQSPTWHLPAHACRLQSALGLPTSALAVDLNQGCSGFVQALVMGARLLTDGGAVLIVTADTYRAKLGQDDRGTRAIFSDGAAAVLLESRAPTHVIAGESHYSDGSGAELLVQRATDDAELFMSGRDVYLFTRRVVHEQIRAALSSAEITLDEVDVALVHQASKLVIDGIERDLAGSQVEVPTNLAQRGNTVSSTIPLLMADTGRPFPGETAVLAGFGVGLSCATAVLRPA